MRKSGEGHTVDLGQNKNSCSEEDRMDWNSGTTLGLALLVIFILYLIDKHAFWRPMFRGARRAGYWLMYAAWVCAIIAGGVWDWAYWHDYRTQKREAAISACVDRNSVAHVAPTSNNPLADLGSIFNSEIEHIRSACVIDPNKTGVFLSERMILGGSRVQPTKSSGSVPKVQVFDPNAPYTDAPPKFNPNAPYH
jgi:hypothetical protein